ncbi:MAG: type II secretion system protein M [Deltaproteobacteria bacterium]|nr:type II secretion system protein M [Deltaproteobacteria bacterium]
MPHERAAAVWSRLRLACEPYIAPVREALIPYWQQAAQWYEKREPREKMLLRVLGGAVILLFIYNAIYLPAREWRDSLAERVATRQQQVIHLRSMMRSYERLRIQLASTQKRTVPGGKDPALFSALEMILTNSVGRAKIGSITPSEHQVPGGFEQYIVDIKLNEIALPQIVDTLYSLQTLNVPITISNLQIHQHAQDSHSFDVDLTCMAVGKTG